MRATALLLCAAALAAAQAPAPADNQAYTLWAKHKPGTAVTLRTVSETAGNKSESLLTQTLVERTDDKVVVEMSAVNKVGGQEFKAPGVKVTHLRKPPASPATTPPTGAAAPPKPVVETAEDTVTVAGVKYKATRTKSTVTTNGLTVESTGWTSDEVPGGVLKSVSKTTGPYATTSTMELVEFKKP